MATTRLAENSAIGTLTRVAGRRSLELGSLPGHGAIRCCRLTCHPGRSVPAIHQPGGDLLADRSGCAFSKTGCSGSPGIEIGPPRERVGVVWDPVGPHACDVLHQLRRVGLLRRWPPNRVGGPQHVRRGQYWLHGPELPCPPLFVPSYPPGMARSGMVMSITPLALRSGRPGSGSPWLRMQAAHSSTSRVALPVDSVVAVLPAPVALLVLRLGPQAGDLRGAVPAAARGQPEGGAAARTASPPGRR